MGQYLFKKGNGRCQNVGKTDQNILHWYRKNLNSVWSAGDTDLNIVTIIIFKDWSEKSLQLRFNQFPNSAGCSLTPSGV